MANADKKYTEKYSSNAKAGAGFKANPQQGFTGNNAQQTQASMEEMMKSAGEQWGENLKNILVSSAISKVFGDIAQGNYGEIGNNYIDVLNAFSEGIEASNMALIASENNVNFLPAGSEIKPDQPSLSVSKLAD